MNSVITLLLIVAAVAIADDVTLSGTFKATESLIAPQTLAIVNERSGDNLTNAVTDLSFVIRENTNRVQIIYPGGSARIQVGAVVAGATGWGQFSVLAANSGRYVLAVTARYRKGGNIDWNYQTALFSLTVYGDVVARDMEESYEEHQRQARDSEVHDFAVRSGSNNDLDVSPSSFYAEDSITTWNNFFVSAGDKNLNNVTWIVIPDDLSVLIGYAPAGNYDATILKNTTISTSISVAGNPGVYYFNVTVRYRRAANINFITWYGIYPCFIDGGGSTSTIRGATIPKTSLLGENSNLVRADVALGIAVGGIALVAAVAVISTIVILKKKQGTTSV